MRIGKGVANLVEQQKPEVPVVLLFCTADLLLHHHLNGLTLQLFPGSNGWVFLTAWGGVLEPIHQLAIPKHLLHPGKENPYEGLRIVSGGCLYESTVERWLWIKLKILCIEQYLYA